MSVTGFNSDWALLYYNACGWRLNVCYERVDEEKTHLRLSGFKAETSEPGINKPGECLSCCSE